MTQSTMFTVKDLAKKVGITPVNLRRLLRKKFNRAGKMKVEHNRTEYRFDPNDPVVKQVMVLVKGKPVDQPKDARKRLHQRVNQSQKNQRLLKAGQLMS